MMSLRIILLFFLLSTCESPLQIGPIADVVFVKRHHIILYICAYNIVDICTLAQAVLEMCLSLSLRVGNYKLITSPLMDRMRCKPYVLC